MHLRVSLHELHRQVARPGSRNIELSAGEVDTHSGHTRRATHHVERQSTRPTAHVEQPLPRLGADRGQERRLVARR